MGLSPKDVVSPVQMQTPEEGCSNKRKLTDEDFMQVCKQEFPDSDYDEEAIELYHAKLNAKLMKKHRKYTEAAIATWKKPYCQATIDKLLGTDLVPGDQLKKTRGKKKKKSKKNENEKV